MAKKLNPTTKFLNVKCSKCNNEQIIFNKPSSDIECLVCGEVLCKSTGGFGEIEGEVLEELE